MLKTEVQSTALRGEVASHPSSTSGLTEIAGYRLHERIGVGGFGEVWRAIGPGGFPKAVKILFGNLSGPQAETELRSLNRIRDLRHPFLLTVERVEIVDGRVVIVTELADRSLDDRFKEIVASGQKGIPRDELIAYLRDAADALDFMSEQHGLQHLDVKPDNLLLQGSHAKVGDFGLTKSLSATGHSLVNGFTPLYAPPELFDGRPERGSDQYSLAIVYQTMLTGVPPFNGRSAAQLTSQHLKSAPDLTVLHPSDRAVVARALSKSPRTRFPSCRQFIDELSKRRYANSSLPRVSETPEPAALNSLTEFVEAGTAGINTSQILPPATPLRPPGTQGLNWFVRPTLFISVGGLGTQALSMLRSRIENRFPGASLPAMHFVCIDADTEAIETIGRGSSATCATTLTTVRVPLRTSHEYRKAPGDHLNWLSRRWLFNIPRSGKVEGMRPLGRLAFVDHQDAIRNRLEKALDHIFLPESTTTSIEESQLPFSRDGLDFVLVGSTSGGTSSGALLDAAWLIKSLALERRLPPCDISAVLIHGTSNAGQAADMQDANTLSFLKELNYFGIPGVQRPAAQNRSGSNSGTAMPLDDAVLMHMGDDLTNVDFQTGLGQVADYLELRSLTPARVEMDSWRRFAANQTDGQSGFQLRTIGLAKVTCDRFEAASEESSLLSKVMLERWINAKPSELTASHGPSPALNTLFHDLALTNAGVTELVPRLFNAERTRRVDEYASSIWSCLGSQTSRQEISERVATLISEETSSATQKSAITAVMEDIRKDLSAGMSRSQGKVTAHLALCLDSPGRIAAGEMSLSHLITAIDKAIAMNACQKSELQDAFADLCSSIAGTTASTDANALKAFCRQYCMLLVCQTVCQSVTTHMKSLRESVVKLLEVQIVQVRKQLSVLANSIDESTIQRASIPTAMVVAFEEALSKNLRFKLSAFLHRDAKPSDAAILTTETTNFLFRSFGATSEQTVPLTPSTTSAFPASARPFLRHVGGGQRVLAAIPEQLPTESWKAQIQNEFGPCVSVCPMNRKDISVLCEVEGITIPSIIEKLSALKPKVVELAGRVHSRQDVPW